MTYQWPESPGRPEGAYTKGIETYQWLETPGRLEGAYSKGIVTYHSPESPRRPEGAYMKGIVTYHWPCGRSHQGARRAHLQNNSDLPMAGVTRAPGGRIYKIIVTYQSMAGVTRAPGGRIYKRIVTYHWPESPGRPEGAYKKNSDLPMVGVTRAPGGRIYENDRDLTLA